MNKGEQINYLKYILDKQLHWINASDTKASIMLSGLGVIITLLSKSEWIKSVQTNLTFIFILGIILMISSSVLFFLTLIPRLKIKKNKNIENIKLSHIYFKDIANSNQENLNRYFKNLNDPREDLIKQVYINAEIANRKMNLCNIGLKLLLLEIPLIIIVYI